MSTAKLLENNETKEEQKETLNEANVLINTATGSQTIPLSRPSATNITDGIYLKWDSIRLEIKKKKKNEQNIHILRGISGTAHPGELYGIIGASGGGKTTLLSMLTGRIKTVSSLSSDAICSGIIEMNNIMVNASIDAEFNYLAKNIAFVMQNDLLFATETCKEAIQVSALLRLSGKRKSIQLTKQDKLNYAQRILNDLDLKKCENTCIGSEETRGLSGGERTRTSIAVELVTNPNIIILDEPTSGLDSASAYHTMILLKELANKGKTVISCIHQPSSEIFSIIDRVLILAKGKVVYEGKVEPDLYNYLKQINYECPQYTNIADYVIQQINKNTQYFIDEWEQNISKIGDELPKLEKGVSTASEMNEIHPRKMINICRQINILMKRQSKIFYRDPAATYVRVIQILFVSILMGLIWWQLKDVSDTSQSQLDVQTNLQNRFGALFLSTSYIAMNAISASNQVFPTQRLVFEKERSGNWYYSAPWILAKFCIDIPWTMIVIIPFALITKFMINLHCKLFWYYFTLILIALSNDSIGFFIGCFAPNQKIAAQCLPIIITPLMIFSGFFISTETIPIYLRWIKWIDPYYYGCEILCILEFDGIKWKNQNVGNQYLEQFNMHSDDKWRDIYILLGLFVFYRIASVVYLIMRNGR